MIIRSDKFIADPTVTCSIIVYNQKDYVGKCIDGMLEQVCDFKFNIVISDDCSTDGTQAILKDYQSRYPEIIKLVLNEKNGGIASNWANCCKAMEGGEFVAFCDGDDFWSLPQKLQLQYDYMCSHGECSGLTTKCDGFDGKNYIWKLDNDIPIVQNKVRIITQEQIWDSYSVINSGGFFFRKDIFDQHMPLDAFIENDFPFQDWPALLIMAGYGEIHLLPISTFTYRIGHESDAHPIDIMKLERRMKCGKVMFEYLHKMFPALPAGEKDYEYYTNDVLLKFCIKTGNYQRAKHYAKRYREKTIRELCCLNYITFHLYRLSRWLKKKYGSSLSRLKKNKLA